MLQSNVNEYTLDPWTRVCTGPLKCKFFPIPVTVPICGWESTDEEGQLYALIYAILYKGFEHPLILVIERGS